MKTNLKTTLSGIIAGIGIVLSNCGNKSLEAIGGIIAAIGTAMGFFFAKDGSS